MKKYLTKEQVVRAIELTGIQGRQDPGCSGCNKKQIYDIYKRGEGSTSLFALLCSDCATYIYDKKGWKYLCSNPPGTTYVSDEPPLVEHRQPMYRSGMEVASTSTETPKRDEEERIDLTEEGILGVNGEFPDGGD